MPARLEPAKSRWPNGGNLPPESAKPWQSETTSLWSDTTLYYYRARYYWPEIGRFLETDPIGYGDQMNLYAYVGNSPLMATDPTGMEKCGGDDPNCFETPESAAELGNAPPVPQEVQERDVIVVTAQRSRRTSNDVLIVFNSDVEMMFAVDANGIQVRPSTQRSVNCSITESVDISTMGRLGSDQSAAHTHNDLNGAMPYPGPGDGSAARQSDTGTAHMLSSERSFAMDSFSDGRFRTRLLSGPPLTDAEASELTANMQNWESGNTAATDAATGNQRSDRERFCR